VQPGRSELRVSFDVEPPSSPSFGRGGAFFVSGCCFHESRRIVGLSLTTGGSTVPAMAFGMPRRDAPGQLYELQDPALVLGSERCAEVESSGFWSVVPIPPEAGGADAPRLELVVGLEGGGSESVTLAEPRPAPPAPQIGAAGGEGLVAICMTTLDPDPELFASQLDSIRAQTHESWSCLIADDGSRADLLERMRDAIGADPRFTLSVAERGHGAYGGFERALSLAPGAASYVALADQHGRWAPGKLAALVEALEGGATLAYTGLRILDSAGEVAELRESDAPADLGSLLLHSPVPGVASAFRRELLEDALPFPPRLGPRSRHDDWLALVATAVGRVERVKSCLHDHVPSYPAPGKQGTSARASRRSRLASLAFGWREAYFADYCRVLMLGTALAVRCGERMPGRRRRALGRIAGRSGTARALALARRGFGGAGSAEARAMARRLLRAAAWPPMISRLTRWRPATRRLLDASLPPVVRDAVALRPKMPPGAAELGRRIESLPIDPSAAQPERVNVLLPAIDLEGLFGGYVGIYNLARRLAERERRARLVPVGYGRAQLPGDWQAQVERHAGLDGLFERVEVSFPREGEPLAVNPNDAFVASSWWTAHVARAALERLERERFVYLIQDHEPSFYPAGSWAALARDSYRLPHHAMFSTELLRDYFRRHRIGAFAGEGGEERSLSFEHAITEIQPAERIGPEGETRRLLFYARPEEYAPRNLFDLGLIALAGLIEEGTLESHWQLNGVGTVTGAQRIELARGVELELKPRQSADRYVDMLRKHDLGLSLMYSPHPSLVPLEMASAGMIVVTNTFENKTAAALGSISEGLIAVEPSLEGVKQGLREGVAAVEDVERRRRGAGLTWSSDWDTSLDDAVMDRVLAWLDER